MTWGEIVIWTVRNNVKLEDNIQMTTEWKVSLTQKRSTMMESSRCRDCFQTMSAATSSTMLSLFCSGNTGFFLTYKHMPHAFLFCHRYPDTIVYGLHLTYAPLHHITYVLSIVKHEGPEIDALWCSASAGLVTPTYATIKQPCKGKGKATHGQYSCKHRHRL